MKTIISILLLFALAFSASAQSPKHEVRAVWLTTIGGIDWPHSYSPETQRKELVSILDKLSRAGINMVHVQARVRATTIFPTTTEPWDGCITGQPGKSPGYDPLQFCIDECHSRGMECHAWIVTIPVGKWNSTGCKQIRQKFPSLIRKIGDEGYMNPEMAQTGDYLAKFCAEVTRRYDIDGIHLDYIRYPETWRIKTSREQGRKHITDIVTKINRAVKSLKPWVKLSCSPIGKYDDLSRYKSSGWNANTTVCQDAQGWLRDGLMDALFPMMYFQGNNFYPFAVDWFEHSYGRIVAPGLAIYMMHPREKNWNLDVITREINFLRQLGLGCTFFRSKFFTDNTKGIYDFTCDFNITPALVPPMSWTGKPSPSAVGGLIVKRGMTADIISWQKAADASGADYLMYNVYASESLPVDVSNPENLIAVRLRDLKITIPNKGRTLHYAVTAMNRYGLESEPANSSEISKSKPQKLDFRSLIIENSPKRYKKTRNRN